MRLIAWLVMLASCCLVLAQEKPVGELEKLQADAVEARKAAAADPTIKNAESKPVVMYLIEQKRRRLSSVAGLRAKALVAILDFMPGFSQHDGNFSFDVSPSSHYSLFAGAVALTGLGDFVGNLEKRLIADAGATLRDGAPVMA